MARDIKKMMRENLLEAPKLPAGHEARFRQKLDDAFAEKNSTNKSPVMYWLKIAAIAIVFFGIGFFGYQQLSDNGSGLPDNPSKTVVDATEENSNEKPKLTLADLSPDLKKLEDYYKTGINVQLASLKITDENKELVDGYMERLAVLDNEYSALNAELTKVGPTESTVTALIDNLKLRLDLLFKLKNKLKELKNQENEKIETLQS